MRLAEMLRVQRVEGRALQFAHLGVQHVEEHCALLVLGVILEERGDRDRLVGLDGDVLDDGGGGPLILQIVKGLLDRLELLAHLLRLQLAVVELLCDAVPLFFETLDLVVDVGRQDPRCRALLLFICAALIIGIARVCGVRACSVCVCCRSSSSGGGSSGLIVVAAGFCIVARISGGIICLSVVASAVAVDLSAFVTFGAVVFQSLVNDVRVEQACTLFFGQHFEINVAVRLASHGCFLSGLTKSDRAGGLRRLLRLLLLRLLLCLVGLCCCSLLGRRAHGFLALGAGDEPGFVQDHVGDVGERGDGDRRTGCFQRRLLRTDVGGCDLRADLQGLRLRLLRIGFLLADVGFCCAQHHLLLFGLGLLLGGFLGVFFGLIRVAHARDLADTLHELVALWNIHGLNNEIEHGDGDLGVDRSQLAQQLHQGFDLRLANSGAPVFLGNDIVSFRADDVVLGQPVVDRDILRCAALVGDAELLFLGHELLHVREGLFAAHLLRITVIIEEPGCGE
ncbi:unknown [Sinorhizobium phage PBC5]|nr:unknown [Sinorhizobium phage PBC5]